MNSLGSFYLISQEEHIKSVKQASEEKTQKMEEQIRSRLQSAAEKREIIEKEMQEKLKEQVRSTR